MFKIHIVKGLLNTHAIYNSATEKNVQLFAFYNIIYKSQPYASSHAGNPSATKQIITHPHEELHPSTLFPMA